MIQDVFSIHTLQVLPGILLGLTVHEFSHAYVAYRYGDTTAKELGRVSLNPLKHIDPAGFFLILMIGFGWAKPVEIDRSRLSHPYDEGWIALAGPFSNAILAFLLSGIIALVAYGLPRETVEGGAFFLNMLLYAVATNWMLFIFNLLPIPPLDGSHVLGLKWGNEAWFQILQRYGLAILIGIFLIEFATSVDILPIGIVSERLTQFSLGIWGLGY